MLYVVLYTVNDSRAETQRNIKLLMFLLSLMSLCVLFKAKSSSCSLWLCVRYIRGTGNFLWVKWSLSQYCEYSEHEEGNISDTSQVSPIDFYL